MKTKRWYLVIFLVVALIYFLRLPGGVRAGQVCGGGVTCGNWVQSCGCGYDEYNNCMCPAPGGQCQSTGSYKSCSGSADGGCRADCYGGCAYGDCNTSGDTCGTAAAPACSGWCGEGTVCRYNQGSNQCVCGKINTFSCADYIGPPSNLNATRLSKTSLQVTWTPGDVKSTSVVSDWQEVKAEAMPACTYTGCVVSSGHLDTNANSYVLTGLNEGGYYTVTISHTGTSNNVVFSQCTLSKDFTYLTSCDLVPDPADVQVGSQVTMTTNITGNMVIRFSSDNTAIASLDKDKDLSYPYLVRATGVTDGIATVTLRAMDNPLSTTPKCEDTAEVRVGSAIITAQSGPWWQAVGGDVYGNYVESNIPDGVAAGNKKLILPDANGQSGLLAYGDSVNLGSNGGTVSDSGWEAESPYGGKVLGYDYFNTKMSLEEKTAWIGGGKPAYTPPVGKDYQIFTHTGDVTLDDGVNTFAVGATEKMIFLVDGSVTINKNVTVAEGGFLAVIASGNIVFGPNVAAADGWYVGNTITVQSNNSGNGDDIQFVGSGSFIGWNGITLSRDRGVTNYTEPSAQFIYRPDLKVNAPEPMRYANFRWSEAAP